jgi:ribonuclease BN (tRNA processing enzyme)
MRVTFLGVGEACDEQLPNTSVWVESDAGSSRQSILLDCGFTVPPQYWRLCPDPNDLDALWISHFHGDHFFGIPALLLRFWELKRAKPLVVVGQRGIEEKVRQTMDLAYPDFLPKLTYPLDFRTAVAGEELSVAGHLWKAAAGGHGQPNLAVHIGDGKRSVFYSGDGTATDETALLAEGCDLLIHEAFRLDEPTPGHGTVVQCIELARRARAPRLALVHVQREERRARHREIMEVTGQVQDIEVHLPEPGDVLTV